MNIKSGIKVFYCLSISVITLYALIEQQNQVTGLQLQLPVLEKEVKVMREKNNELRYHIARIEDPKRLFNLLQDEYKGLVFPNEREVVEISCPLE